MLSACLNLFIHLVIFAAAHCRLDLPRQAGLLAAGQERQLACMMPGPVLGPECSQA